MAKRKAVIKENPASQVAEQLTAETGPIDLLVRFDREVHARLTKMQKAKGEFSVQPLIRFATVDMLERAGF